MSTPTYCKTCGLRLSWIEVRSQERFDEQTGERVKTVREELACSAVMDMPWYKRVFSSHTNPYEVGYEGMTWPHQRSRTYVLTMEVSTHRTGQRMWRWVWKEKVEVI